MADLSECQVGVGCLQCLRTVKPPTIGVLILPTLEGWKTEAIAFSSNISSTYLADCKLITFPIALYKVMRHVAEGIHLITLANNELKSVTSKFIITFSQLRELNLEGNYIHHLPEEVRTLLHLRNINLSRNKFHIFPDQLTSLQALEMINLEENEITGKKICSCAFNPLPAKTELIGSGTAGSPSLFPGHTHGPDLSTLISILVSSIQLYLCVLLLCSSSKVCSTM
uniref:Leucine rich repeat containing 20 n=1 Tax=Laticauda laticaudata TaxID=8630 RepID=A0A8C5RGY4_LATLA